MIAKGESEAVIDAKYFEAADLVTFEEYHFDVDLLRRAARGEQGAHVAVPKAPVSMKVKKGAKRKNKAKSSPPVEPPATTQAAIEKKTGISWDIKRFWFPIAAAAIVAFLSLWLIPLPSIGQHIVGGVGGVIVYVGALLLTRQFGKKNWMLFGILLLLTAALGSIYGLAFPERYRILAYWITGYAIFFSAINIYLAFSVGETGMGAFAVTVTLIIVALMIFLGVFKEMTLVGWQNVIGLLGGGALVAGLWGVCVLLRDRKEAYFPHFVLVVPFLVANMVLRFVLKDVFYVISIWIGVFLLASCIFSSVQAEKREDGVYYLVGVAESCLSFVMLAITMFHDL